MPVKRSSAINEPKKYISCGLFQMFLSIKTETDAKDTKPKTDNNLYFMPRQQSIQSLNESKPKSVKINGVKVFKRFNV